MTHSIVSAILSQMRESSPSELCPPSPPVESLIGADPTLGHLKSAIPREAVHERVGLSSN